MDIHKGPYFLLFSISLAFGGLPAQAIQFEFVGVHSEVIYQGQKEVLPGQSVGSFTVQVLQEAKKKGLLDFKATEASLKSINDLASDTELEDYEILSDEEMNTYGWCFTLDGALSTEMPDRTFFSSNQVRLRWFYAYAHYNREWKDWCLPVEKKRIK